MKSLASIFIVVSVTALSVYLANRARGFSETKNRKLDNAFTFCLPCIAALSTGIAVMTDFLLLPIIVTGALLAGSLSLLVSLTSEQKQHDAKGKRPSLHYIVFILFRNCSMPQDHRQVM